MSRRDAIDHAGEVTRSVRRELSTLSSHPRTVRKRLVLWSLAMFIPTLGIAALLIFFLTRSVSLTNLQRSIEQTQRSFIVLLASAAFFATAGATALLALRMSRVRSLSRGGEGADWGTISIAAGVVLLVVLIPAVMLDAAVDPWVRLLAHLSAPLPLLLLLGGLNVAERDETDGASSRWRTILGILALVPVVAGLVMLSDFLVPSPETWGWLVRFLPDGLAPEWRSLAVRLLSFQVLLVLGATIWMARGLLRSRDRSSEPADEDWVEQLEKMLEEEDAESRRRDRRPLLRIPPKLRKRERRRGAAEISGDRSYAALFPTGHPSQDQVDLIRILKDAHGEVLERVARNGGRETGLESCSVLVLSELEGGFDEVVTAAALLARLRGQRVLVIAATRERAVEMLESVRVAIKRAVLSDPIEAMSIADEELPRRLFAAAASREGGAAGKLPDILVATRGDLDEFIAQVALETDPRKHRSGEPDRVSLARDLLGECEMVLVDLLDRFPAEDRFAIPFVLALLRTMIRAHGGIEQCLVGLSTSPPADDDDSGDEADAASMEDGSPGSAGDAPPARVALAEPTPRAQPSSAEALFDRLFEISRDQPRRIARLRTRSKPGIERFEVIAESPDQIATLETMIRSVLQRCRARTAVWKRPPRDESGSLVRRRFVEMDTPDALPDFDAITRDCLLLLPEPSGAPSPAQEIAVLEAKFTHNRDPDSPLRVVHLLRDKPRQRRSKPPFAEPRLILLPDTDDAAHGTPYLAAAAMLLEADTPVRRSLLDGLGVPAPSEFRGDGGEDAGGVLLLHADPPDRSGSSSDHRIFPIVWRSDRCSGLDDLSLLLPRRHRQPTAPHRCRVASPNGDRILLTGEADRSNAVAQWRIDGRDDHWVDLARANDLALIGEGETLWPQRLDPGSGGSAGALVLHAARWNGDGRETFLPVLGIDSIEIPSGTFESVLRGGLLLSAREDATIHLRFHGVASPGNADANMLKDPITLQYRASVAVLAGDTLGRTDHIDLPDAATGIWQGERDPSRTFLPRTTARFAAAFGYRAFGLLEFARVVAFWSHELRLPLLFLISPAELGRTVRNTVEQLAARDGFLRTIALDAANAQVEERTYQPIWSSPPGASRETPDAIDQLERNAIDLLRERCNLVDAPRTAFRKPIR